MTVKSKILSTMDIILILQFDPFMMKAVGNFHFSI